MQHNKSLLSIHFAVLMFGLAGVIGKAVSLPAITVTLGRVLFSSLFLYAIITIKKEPLQLSKKADYRIVLCAGIVMAIHWSAFMQSIQVSTVAIGTVTFSTFPLFVTFIEPYFFRTKLKMINIAQAIVMLLGVFLIVPSFELGNQMTQGILWGMLGSLSYAALSLLNRKLSSSYNEKTICFYEQAVAAIILLPTLLLIHPSITPTDLFGLAVLGVVCTGIAHTMFVAGLKRVNVQTAGIISGMESVYGILLALLILHEIPSPREVTGAMIILGITFYSTFTAKPTDCTF